MTSARIGVGGDVEGIQEESCRKCKQRFYNVSSVSFYFYAVVSFNKDFTSRKIYTGFITTRTGRRTQIMATH